MRYAHWLAGAAALCLLGGTAAAATPPTGATKSQPAPTVAPADSPRQQIINSGPITIAAGDKLTKWTYCPTGTLATGGGESNNRIAGVTLHDTFAFGDGSAWLVSVSNDSTVEATFTVYAICWSGISGYHQITRDSVAEPGGDSDEVLGSCPNGIALGGGGLTDSWETTVGENHPYPYPDDPGLSWAYHVHNPSSTTANVTTVLICGASVTSQEVTGGSVTVGSGQYGLVSGSCPAGTVLLSGGSIGQSAQATSRLRITDSYPDSAQSWRTYVHNDDTQGRVIQSDLLCGT